MDNETQNSLPGPSNHSLKDRLHAAIQRLKDSKFYQETKLYMFTKSAEEAGYNTEADADLRVNLQKPLKFAFAVIAVAVGFFVVWGGLAPLDSAAAANGYIIVSSNHKTIQHHEGGIVEAIYVSDGQEVKKGELLVKLDDTQALASLKINSSQLAFVMAENARLKAEQLDADNIDWDFKGINASSEDVQQIKKTQEHLFLTRRMAVKGNLNILTEQANQRTEEIKGLEFQLESYKKQLANTEEEEKTTLELFNKGLSTKPKLLQLRSATADLSGRIGQIMSNISAAKQQIAETKVKMLSVQNDYQKQLGDEIKENHRALLDLTERYNAAQDVFDRTNITAPVDGVVTELKVHTVGGTVQQGAIVMEIVPQNDKLIIEISVRPEDIDSVHLGMLAKVQLGAYKARLVPRMDGRVIYVAADKNIDQRSGAPGYIVRVQIDEKELDQLTADIKLFPGMPATVFLVKGTRTFLQYLISPIMDSFYRAFKEK
jgi:HlyD family type I secretion membrane fusion protein